MNVRSKLDEGMNLLNRVANDLPPMAQWYRLARAWIQTNTDKLRFKMAHKTREKLWNRLAYFLADMKLDDALDRLAQRYQKRDKFIGRAIAAWQREVDAGSALPNAMRSWAPPHERIMIESGFLTKAPSAGFASAVSYREQLRKLKSEVRGVLTYPALLLSVAIAILWASHILILPLLADLVAVGKWPLPASSFRTFIQFLANNSGSGAITLIVLFAVLQWALPNWATRQRADNFLPFSWYRRFQGAAILMALGALIKHKEPLDSALTLIRSVSAPWAAHRMNLSLVRLGNGTNPGVALDTGLFDADTAWDLKDFSATSEFDRAIAAISAETMSNTVVSIKQTTLWLRFSVFFATPLIAIWMLLAVVSIAFIYLGSMGLGISF